MNKMTILAVAILGLLILNVFLFRSFIKDSMSGSEINMPTTQEKADRIMSVATGGGIPQTGLEMKKLIIGQTEVIAEIADTEEKRRIGEMFRGAMKEKDAMIFIFDQEQELGFRMQNTYIGLDLLYVGSNGVIKHIHNNAKPLDLTSLPSTVPVKYVIEVRDDFVESFGVKVGDKVEGI